jgi:hypothetical protein
MPGYTVKYRLPYMLDTEGLWTIAQVTRSLADRLDAVMSSGELKGAPGTPGVQGATGPAGPQGPTGATGATGAAGPAGPTGPAGPQGERGATGPAGPAGPQGEDGQGIELRGSVPTAADLPGGLTPADAGTAYTTDDGHLHVWSGSSWRDLGALEGPEGPAGPAGPQGPQGVQGATGPQGPAGPTGPKGDTGATGPAGPKGDTGATGPQGPQGPAGPAAPQVQIARFEATGIQSIPHNSATAFNLPSAKFNTAGLITSSNTFAVPASGAGIWEISAQVAFAWNSSVTGERRGTIRSTNTDGTGAIEHAIETTATESGILNMTTGPILLTAERRFQLQGFQFTNAPLNTAGAALSWLTFTRLRDAP